MKTKITIAASILALALCVGATGAFAQAADQPAPAAPAADQAAAPAETAAPSTPAEQPAATPPTSTDTTAVAPAGSVGPAPADKGQIVFYRPSKLTGGALSFSVHEGTTGVGKLGNGQYFVLTVAPGVHEYSSQSESKDTLRLEVEAGETYYVAQTIGMGIMMGRPHLTPSDKAAFEKKSLKLSTKTASDVKS